MSRPSSVATVAFFRGGLRQGRARTASLDVGWPWKDQERRACRALPGRIQVAWYDAQEDQGRVDWHPEGPRARSVAPGRMNDNYSCRNRN